MDYGYIRYSHSTQERGSSVDRQKKLILDRCPNILEENIFIDKGVSAWSGDNLKEGSEWYRLMKTIVAGDCIYVEQADRVTRKGLDEIQKIFRGVRDKGVSVVTTVDGKLFEANKDTTTEEAISLVLAGSLGKAESDTKSRRVRESYTKRNAEAAANPQNGKKIKIPLASWIEHEDGKYILNERAGTVKLIFDLCISGMGAAALAIELNKRGIKPFRLEKKEEKEGEEGESKFWGAASVFVILRNKATYGTYTPNAWKVREAKRLKQPYDNLMQEITNYFPAVVTEEIFWQAQEALRLRRTYKTTKQTQGETPFNIWQGVAACACGARLHVKAKGRNKERYLVCADKVRNKSGCNAGNIREDVAEKVFKELLTKINVVELLENKKPDIDVLKIETELARERASHDDAVKDLNDNGYNSSLSAYIRRTEQKIKELEQSLATAQDSNLQAVMLLEDKNWLMDNIKLETREQRHRANVLLKKLGITVGMWRDSKTNDTTFHAEGVITYFLRDGEIQEIARSIETWEKLKVHNPHIGYGISPVGRLHLEGKHKEANNLKQALNKLRK